ncbi:Gfo/Idh/MocA family protein [Streptomyces zhihengii]|uniref:Gfo/Idh/MocA family protein n=1 Tax=Streptomyces zhihengii TaxID=1818004 RepID=UPI001FD04A6C
MADSQFAQLAAVCDTDSSKVAVQAQQHSVPGFTDLRALLEDVRPDFAIVAVPHHAGREVIETCAAAGVHVMKEKPFATGPAEAAELVALCDKAGIELMVTVQRRFHPVYNAAVQLLEQIGRPYLVEGRYTFHCGFAATDDTELYYRVLLHGQYSKRCRREIPADHELAPYAVTGMGLKLRIHPRAAALARPNFPG